MTIKSTLETISECPLENWAFWTQYARLSLWCYRNEVKQFGRRHGFTRLSRAGFRANMRKRRAQEYLDDDKKAKSAEERRRIFAEAREWELSVKYMELKKDLDAAVKAGMQERIDVLTEKLADIKSKMKSHGERNER